MAREVQRLDVSQLPDVLALAEQVQQSETPRILIRADGEELARIMPAAPKRGRARGRRIAANDPIWDIIGIGRSEGGPTNVSEHVDEFLAAWEVAQNRPL